MSVRTGARPAVTPTLLVTQCAFNVGFYAVVPFLAVRLHDDLAASGTAIALVLAVRTFSQQGMFVVGGALADRFGPRRAIVAGTAVRTVGYLGLALAGTVPLVMVAAVLTGLGGALFSPALESLLAGRRTPDDTVPRDRRFALLAVCGEAGALLGPVLGGLLMRAGFPVAALAGAGLFAVAGVVLWRVLPPSAPATPAPAASWRLALTDRRFLLFCFAYASYLLSYQQLYVALPVELDRVGAGDDTLVAIFLLAAVLVVIGQLPVATVTRRIPPGIALAVGFVLMATGFVVVATATTDPSSGPLPALTWVVLLAAGQMTVVPVAMAQVAGFARDRPSGAYFGLLATAGGVAVLAGSFVIGPFLDAARTTGPAAASAWWLMALFPAASAVGMAVLLRRRSV